MSDILSEEEIKSAKLLFQDFLQRPDRPEELSRNINRCLETQSALQALDVINRTIEKKLSAMKSLPGQDPDISIGILLKSLPAAIYKVKSRYKLAFGIDFHRVSLSWLSYLLDALFETSGNPFAIEPKALANFNTIKNYRNQVEALIGEYPSHIEELFFRIIRTHCLSWISSALKNQYRLIASTICTSSESDLSDGYRISMDNFSESISILLHWTLFMSIYDIAVLFEFGVIPELMAAYSKHLSMRFVSVSASIIDASLCLPASISSAARNLLFMSEASLAACAFFESFMSSLQNAEMSYDNKCMKVLLCYYEAVCSASMQCQNPAKSHLLKQSHRAMFHQTLENIADKVYQSFVKFLVEPSVCIRFISSALDELCHHEDDLCTTASPETLMTVYQKLFIIIRREERSFVISTGLFPSFITVLWQKQSELHIQAMFKVALKLKEIFLKENTYKSKHLYFSILAEIGVCSKVIQSEAARGELYTEDSILGIFNELKAFKEFPQSLHDSKRDALPEVISKSRPIELIMLIAEKHGFFVHQTNRYYDEMRVYLIEGVEFYLAGASLFCNSTEDAVFRKCRLLHFFRHLFSKRV